MPWYQCIWSEQTIEHLDQHGISPEDFEYVLANAKTKLKSLRDVPKKESGTTVWFKPDKEIFTDLVYRYDTLAMRVRELSFESAQGVGQLIIHDRFRVSETGTGQAQCSATGVHRVYNQEQRR